MSELIWGLLAPSAPLAGSSVGLRGWPCHPCSPSPGAAKVLLLQGLGSHRSQCIPALPRLPHPNHPAWPAFATHFKQQTHNKPLLPTFSVPTLLPWGRSQHPCSQPRGLPQASAPHAAQFAPRVCTSSSSRAVPATSIFIQIHGGKLCSMVKEKQQ